MPLLRSLARKALGDANVVAERLILRHLAQSPAELRAEFDRFTETDARAHFGPEEPIVEGNLIALLRFFHAWRVHMLRERLGPRLADAEVLDVGDTDGSILRALGKGGTGFNISPVVVEQIRANGVEAVLGDGHSLPFADASFDVVLCFETLEHVESPIAVLREIRRVLRPGGNIFVSVPWVPSTRVQPLQPGRRRGVDHCIEFAPADFEALMSHVPLDVAWSETCETLARTRSLRELLRVRRGGHILGGGFVRFQVLELRAPIS